MKLKFTIIIFFVLNLSFSQKIVIKKLDINSRSDHFAPVYNNGKIVFSSNTLNKKGQIVTDEIHGFSYSLYEGIFNSESQIENVIPLKIKERNYFNMSISTFSKDGRYMYFTSNSEILSKNKARGKKMYGLQIQRAEYVENIGWTNFTVLPFCNSDFNYGHPALSPDESTLYFVSNSDGAKGKTDLFKVSVSNHTSYGEPEKLNDTINSSRTELHPFISSDNKLYFSSDRRGGVGGYDIYSYDLSASSTNTIPKLLPEPLNTVAHDLTFFLMDDLKSGFITSRRYRSYGGTGDKGKGGDDIYYFNW